jgi:hypothetical protein
MLTEHVFLGHPNAIDLVLQDDRTGVMRSSDLSGVTRVLLELTPQAGGARVTVDSDEAPTAFDWSGGGGALSLLLGAQPLVPGRYAGRLVVCSADAPGGLVWADAAGTGGLLITVHAA